MYVYNIWINNNVKDNWTNLLEWLLNETCLQKLMSIKTQLPF